MKAFKFACPVCGQHINADADGTGSQIECPTCFQNIVIPQAPATEDGKFILSASQVRKPRPVGAPPTESSPALAIRSSKVPWLAIAAGGVLLCGAVSAFVLFRDAIFKSSKPNPQQTASANVPVAAPIPAEPDARWKLDFAEAAFTDTSADGRVHGATFKVDRAYLQNGTMTLRQGASGTADLSVSIALAKQEENWDGNALVISPANTSAPKVTLRWRTEGTKTATQSFSSGYAMKLEVGKVANEKASGKIYLCTPDDAKSLVVGTFTLEIRKPRAPRKAN